MNMRMHCKIKLVKSRLTFMFLYSNDLIRRIVSVTPTSGSTAITTNG